MEYYYVQQHGWNKHRLKWGGKYSKWMKLIFNKVSIILLRVLIKQEDPWCSRNIDLFGKYIFIHVYNSLSDELNKWTKKQKQMHRYRKQTDGSQRGGWWGD